MKNRKFTLYYLLSSLGILLASYYPLTMGVRVVTDMIRNGTVRQEDYPKYIIPYTPVSLAVICGVLLMPLLFRLARRFAVAAASALSVGVFFLSELMLENMVIITGKTVVYLEDWQMYLCYIPPESMVTRTWKAVDVLIGEYSPTFKIHFYLISLLLILSILNCFYGFGQIVRTGEGRRMKSLILQSASSLVFLGLCIFACFTAFYRTGEVTVSPLSAVLMCLFFIVLGVTAGVYCGSFLTGRRRLISLLIPGVTSSLVTTAMYIGELFLLSGNLYRFGHGFFFDGLGKLALAPVDICVILLSGGICAMVLSAVSGKIKAEESAAPDTRE